MANYFNPYQNNPMYNPYYSNYFQNGNSQTVQPQEIQSGGIVPVSSEKEAMDYLVAQGTSVMFIDGKNQKMYVKTRGFSPVEQPTFKRYKLVEVAEGEAQADEGSFIDYAKKSEIEALKGDIERINSKLKELEVKDNE